MYSRKFVRKFPLQYKFSRDTALQYYTHLVRKIIKKTTVRRFPLRRELRRGGEGKREFVARIKLTYFRFQPSLFSYNPYLHLFGDSGLQCGVCGNTTASCMGLELTKEHSCFYDVQG